MATRRRGTRWTAGQQHWVECVRAGRAPETAGEDNLRTMELVHGAYWSAATWSPYPVGGSDGD